MATLESSNPKCDLYCRLRKQLVAHTPEEEVRQSYLNYLLDEKKVPSNLIAVEVALSSLVPKSARLPRRRIDILLFQPTAAGLLPWLLIECKAEPIHHAAVRQITGYNLFLRAPYLCLVNQTERLYGTFNEHEGWLFSDKEPPFPQ